jgi:hypothetical protein
MERTEWEKQYREQCYRPVFKQYMEEMLQDHTDRAEEINRKLNGCVEAFMVNLGFLQEKGKMGAIQTISISFPYTSLACGEPYLLFEVYPGVPFMEDALVFREFPAPWLFSRWEELQQKLREVAGKQGMNAVIRMPFIRSHALAGARYVLYFWSSLMKYHLRDIEKKEAFQSLEKADDFCITFGEYMDRQSLIWISRKETDIFFCEEGTDLRFCRFRDVWYEDKRFDALVLDDCRFQTCTFQNCSFVEGSLKDARFVGCTFQNCSFTGTNIAGAEFDGCKFEEVQMERIHTYFLSKASDSIPAAAGNATFAGCFFIGVNLKDSDFSAGYVRDCRMETVLAESCVLSESFQAAVASDPETAEGEKP